MAAAAKVMNTIQDFFNWENFEKNPWMYFQVVQSEDKVRPVHFCLHYEERKD